MGVARTRRRSLSICGPLYRRLRKYAADRGTSMTAVVEDLIAQITQGEPDPGPAYEPRNDPRKGTHYDDRYAGAHFTF